MPIMTKLLKENVKYRIVHNSDFDIYAIKKNGYIYIRCKDDEGDRQWLDDQYLEAKVLLKGKDDDEMDYCYLLLREEYDMCSVVEVVSKKLVKCLNYSEYVKAYRRTIEINNEDVKDVVIVLWEKDDKYYGIWSLRKGIVYCADEYEELDRCSNGAIIDGKIAVDDSGFSYNISSYEEVCENVYFDKEKNTYQLFVDEHHVLFVPMEKTDYDEDIVELEWDDRVYKYDISTDSLTTEFLSGDVDTDWSQYTDIAYEGHSRLELGLD